MASADSEVRPGTQALGHTPRQAKAGETGPKAYPHPPCRFRAADCCRNGAGQREYNKQLGARRLPHSLPGR